MKNISKRNSSIELLRILAAAGVIILHYNNSFIGGGFEYVENGSINYYILNFLESLAICAVNLFILISGYFMCEVNKTSLRKPMELIIQVIVFGESVYLLNSLVGNVQFSVKGLLNNLLPCNWFTVLYVALYLLAPYINILWAQLDLKQCKRLLITILLLFSVWPTFIDIIGVLGFDVRYLSTIGYGGNQDGYTIVNFIIAYLVGAYIRKTEREEYAVGSGRLGLLLFISTSILFFWSLVDTHTAWEYCNPLVILNAMLLFKIFLKWQIPNINLINVFAKGAFTVYLLHYYLLNYVQIEKFVNKNAFLLLLHILLTCIGIYFICWCVYFVYDKVMLLIYKMCKSITGNK